MESFKGKQGIELEGVVRKEGDVKGHLLTKNVNRSAYDAFHSNISNRFCLDDGKPELPSNPHNSLGTLDKEISADIASACDVADDNGWIYELIGADPYMEIPGYSQFGSLHIHNSMEVVPSKEAEIKMRAKLFSVQPFLELLGMNTCVFSGVPRNVKDARIAYSSWSMFTLPNEHSTGHYMALASGRKAMTCEVRLPSSASKDQSLAVTSFIKAVIMMDKVPVLPVTFVEDMFYKTIKWGGQAVVPIKDASRLSYLGIDGDEIYVTIADLFKKFITDKETKSVIDTVLKELVPTSRNNVNRFFKLIADGYTVSDLTHHLFMTKSPVDVVNKLGDCTHETYANNKSILDILEVPKELMFPRVKLKLSLEEIESELREKSNNIKTNYRNIGLLHSEVDECVFTGQKSIAKNDDTRRVFKWLVRNSNTLNNKKLPAYVNGITESFLIKNNILDNVTPLKLGKNFPIVAQLAVDSKLI